LVLPVWALQVRVVGMRFRRSRSCSGRSCRCRSCWRSRRFSFTAEQLSEQASQNAADQKGQQHPQQ
jgi:hypothetical protein